jgi:hypothetical protein
MNSVGPHKSQCEKVMKMSREALETCFISHEAMYVYKHKSSSTSSGPNRNE